MSRCPSLPSALLLILIPLTGTTQTLSLDGAWRTHDANPPSTRSPPARVGKRLADAARTGQLV
ncbi:hypothetical protein [Edwardsiella tarda]|uniref:hypothetical protein n=1 Tax=Edwardsiella tarda TaxID=636 RepID=UPI00351C0F4E